MFKSYSSRSSLFEAVTQPAALLQSSLAELQRPVSRKVKSQGYNMIKLKVQKDPFLKGEPFKVHSD